MRIIPARALAELARIAQSGESVEVAVHDEPGRSSRTGSCRRRGIDGQFPNIKQLLPETFEHELAAAPGRGDRRRPPRVGDGTAKPPLRLRFTEGELRVSALTQDVGEAAESMPVPFAGEPLEIGFNAEFLRDGLESVDGDDLWLRLISPLRPGLIQDERGDFWYLPMPIRLAG